MVRGLLLVMLAACAGQDPAPRPAFPPPRPVPDLPVEHEPAIVPPAPIAAWRAKLAEAVQLRPLAALQVNSHEIDSLLESSERELMALVAQLPDDSPDLPEAACMLLEHSRDRRQLETQLLRGIAVARTRGQDATALYGSLRDSMLSVQIVARLRNGKLDHDLAQESVLGGQAWYSCATPDVGHLRSHLADVYLSEERYPEDPFTGAPDRGPFTSKKNVANAGLAELDGMYRELLALAPEDPAVATVLELARVECPTRPLGRPFSVCVDRTVAARRILELRERTLAASNPALLDSRLVQARLLLAARKTAAGEALLRRVLADAPRNTPQRLHATLDLVAVIHARDAVGAAQLAADVVPDLAQPPGPFTWEWSEIGSTLADLAVIDHREADAIAIFRSLDKAFTPPNPACVPEADTCDNRWTRIHVLERLADLDPAASQALGKQALQLGVELQQLRARLGAEAERRTRSPSR